MFTSKTKTDMSKSTAGGNGTTLLSAGTILKGDISSSSDLRIDGKVTGKIVSTAKIVVGVNGIVEGDISGNQADIMGKVTGNIRTKDLLQIRDEAVVTGNIYASKLQIEPSATFNGECHMGANIVDISNNEQQAIAK